MYRIQKNSKNTSSIEFNDCPICLKFTNVNQIYVTSVCNHIFHKSCYKKIKNNSCLVCLSRITQCREYLSSSYPIIQYMTNFHILNITDSYYMTLNDNNKRYIRQFIFEDIDTHANIRKNLKYNNFYMDAKVRDMDNII